MLHRGPLILALAAGIVASPAVASAQASQDPCVCPVRGDRGGVAGLLGLAALGLARLGTGVSAFVAEPVQGPVLATAPIDEAAPPVAAVGARAAEPDTARMPPATTDTLTAQPAPATPAAPRAVAMAAPAQDEPLGIVAPRTATNLPLLFLIGLTTLLAGIALLVVRRRQATAAAPPIAARQRHSPYTVVLLGGKPLPASRLRIR